MGSAGGPEVLRQRVRSVGRGSSHDDYLADLPLDVFASGRKALQLKLLGSLRLGHACDLCLRAESVAQEGSDRGEREDERDDPGGDREPGAVAAPACEALRHEGKLLLTNLLAVKSFQRGSPKPPC